MWGHKQESWKRQKVGQRALSEKQADKLPKPRDRSFHNETARLPFGSAKLMGIRTQRLITTRIKKTP